MNNYDGPGVGRLTQKIASSSIPWPLPGLLLLQVNTDRCIISVPTSWGLTFSSYPWRLNKIWVYPRRKNQFFTPKSTFFYPTLKEILNSPWRIPLILTPGGYIMTSLVTSLVLICFDHLNVFDTPSGPCVVQRLFLHNVWDRSPSDNNFKQTLWKGRSCCHWRIWWERLVMVIIHFTVLHLWSVIYYILGWFFITFMVGITCMVEFYDIYG